MERTLPALAVMLALAALPGASEAPRVLLSGRIDTAGAADNRLELGRRDERLLVITTHVDGEPRRVDAGLSLPWVTAGPVRLEGLVRELYNPLGYEPDSSVFAERPGLSLDGSFDGGAWHGVLLRPWPEVLGLFGVEGPHGRAVGGFLCPGTDVLGVEAVMVAAAPPPEPWGEGWYRDRPPFPGGPLLVPALRLRWEGAAPSAASAWVLGAASAGSHVPPGWLGSLGAGWSGERLQARLLGGVVSQGFLTPAGEPAAHQAAASAAAEHRLPGGVVVICRGGWYADPSPAPGAEDRRPAEADAEGAVRLDRGDRLTWSVGMSYRVERTWDPDVEDRRALAAAVGLAAARLRVESTALWSDAAPALRASADLTGRVAAVALGLRWGAGELERASLEIAAGRAGRRLSARCDWDGARGPEARFAWEIRSGAGKRGRGALPVQSRSSARAVTK